MAMRILIIGSTSSLCAGLAPTLSTFAEVYTAGRKCGDIALDLTDVNTSAHIPENLDLVINTAAHFGGTGFHDYLDAMRVNVAGMLSLLNLCKKAKTKWFMQISSIYALLDSASPYFSIYSLTKKHADEIAGHFCSAHAIPLTVLRPAPIYGNDDRFRKHQPFFYTMIDKAEKGEDINIYGTRDAKRNYIHIEDLVAVIQRVAQQQLYGLYACTHTMDTTLSGIADVAYGVFARGGNWVFNHDKPDIPDNVFPADHSLYEKLHYYPQISIEEGITLMSEYRKRLA